jgi:hypothetical protein
MLSFQNKRITTYTAIKTHKIKLVDIECSDFFENRKRNGVKTKKISKDTSITNHLTYNNIIVFTHLQTNNKRIQMFINRLAGFCRRMFASSNQNKAQRY